jgi:hypothetical protein
MDRPTPQFNTEMHVRTESSNFNDADRTLLFISFLNDLAQPERSGHEHNNIMLSQNASQERIH